MTEVDSPSITRARVIREWVEAFRIADRLVTNQQFLDFVLDGGYQRPELWLSDGWAAKNENGWAVPLYWESIGRRLAALFPCRTCSRSTRMSQSSM